MALRDAGIEKFNLVTVTSILPPGCEEISKEEGLMKLVSGEIVFLVMSRISSNEPSRRLSAAIGCALPSFKNDFGYISEYHSYGVVGESAETKAIQIARDMFKTLKFGEPKQTIGISSHAEVDNDGKWTTVIAAAVFII